jgi:hypothetical protein
LKIQKNSKKIPIPAVTVMREYDTYVEYSPYDLIINLIYGLVLDQKALAQIEKSHIYQRLSKKSNKQGSIYLNQNLFAFKIS